MSDKKHNNKKWNIVWKSGIFCMLLFVICGICIKFGFHQKENFAASGSSEVTRGVIDSISELPSSKRDGTSAELGTKENPFLILEIVPYEEYAEIGYLISGCEPVKIEEMYGTSDLKKIADNKVSTVTKVTDAYFFADEPEADASKYEDSVETVTESMTLDGYYERVKSGEGQFKQKDDKTIEYVGEGSGNIIWHTTQSYEADYGSDKFSDDIKKKLDEVGERAYTRRTSDPAVDELYHPATYYAYENSDYFLTDSLGLSEDEAEEYSVVVKTITPAELNDKPSWIKHADLVYISPTSNVSGFVDIWKEYNRLGHSVTSSRSDTFVGNDIDWEVAEKLFMKVTDRKDYCGIIMNEAVYDVDKLSGKEKVEFKVCDWNGDATSVKYEANGSNNNIYKLSVMLLSMDPYAFRSIYFNDDTTLISSGNFRAQSGNASTKWTQEIFIPTKADGSTDWEASELWDNYKIKEDLISSNDSDDDTPLWTVGRVHVFNKKTSILTSYTKSSNWCKEFKEGSSATTADAVSYILDADKHSEPAIAEKIQVLDLEPCIDYNGEVYDGNTDKGYYVTEQFFRWLLPSYSGDITVTHQTTAEFIGKIEDLNSEYDLIYMGLDSGAYNHKSDGSTDWNDDSLDGLVYIHTGDKVLASGYSPTSVSRSVDWLTNTSGSELRISGNDITKLKKTDLDGFTNSGLPVVALDALYDLDTSLVDNQSNIYDFVRDNKSKDNMCSTSQAANVLKALQNQKPNLNLIQKPLEYNVVASGGSVTNQYLNTSGGKAYMTFKFKVDEPGAGVTYGYRIYMDKNRDGKLTSGEKIKEGSFSGNETVNKTCYLSSTFIGVVQWKLEVYRKDKPSLRTEETGFSAVKNTGAKKEINVLQIMPTDDSRADGYLNLQTNGRFLYYFGLLDEYDIKVKAITVAEFESYFVGSGFSFDKSKDISATNPVDYSTTIKDNVDKYDMIIVGFGDIYGGVNISNVNGAVDYIDYYIAQGRSILLTHDLSSLHNVPSGSTLPFGFSANTLLRDVMGMNRYKALNKNLTDAEKASIRDYQNKQTYDSISSAAIHGYTYYAIKRLAWGSNDNVNNGYKMPFKYMIKGPKNEYTCPSNSTTKLGFNNNNDLTTKLSQVNQGQITAYPFYIAPNAKIASTHAQWYQLNMEDDEITVWYCLADDKNAIAWNGGDSNQRGTAVTYGVSPNDVANNYYIYSKDNVFYSGVGHSTEAGGNLSDNETKLFINTMIAAYRQSYEPPEVVVKDATQVESHIYSVALTQEYDPDTSATTGGNSIKKETFSDTEVERVYFELNDYNLDANIKDCTIYYTYTDSAGMAVKSYIDKIYDESGTPITANAEHKFTGLTTAKIYYLEYPKKYLSEWTDGTTAHPAREIKFEVTNDKISSAGITTLHMAVKALFQLD